MKGIVTIRMLLCAIVCTGCITPVTYGPIGGENHATYGYTDRRSHDGHAILLVIVPAYSNSATAHEFWDRRAREICESRDYTRNIFRAERATQLYDYYGGRPGDYFLEGYVICTPEETPQKSASEISAVDSRSQ
jgi:hypothetical protein